MSNVTKSLPKGKYESDMQRLAIERTITTECSVPISENRLRSMNICFLCAWKLLFLLLLPSVISNTSVFSSSILCSFLSHTIEDTIRPKKNGHGGEQQQDQVKIMSNHHTTPHYFERSFRSRFVHLFKTSHSNDYVLLLCGRTSAQTAVTR